MLFSNQRRHNISLPVKDGNGNQMNVGSLVEYLCENLMKDTRRELFVLDGRV
jgi:ubiquitin related modifier 1